MLHKFVWHRVLQELFLVEVMPLSAHRHPHCCDSTNGRVSFAGTSHFLDPVLLTTVVDFWRPSLEWLLERSCVIWSASGAALTFQGAKLSYICLVPTQRLLHETASYSSIKNSLMHNAATLDVFKHVRRWQSTLRT